MKYLVLTCLMAVNILPTWAQKKLIDTNVFDKWPTVKNPDISSDGKYVVYTIDKLPMDNHTLVIQATDNKWKKEIIGASAARFTKNGKRIFFKTAGDSVCFWQLGTDHYKYYPHVQGYQLVEPQKREWLAMQMTGEAKELRLQDMTGSVVKSYAHVSDFTFSKNGTSLLIQTQEQSGGQTKNRVYWINLQKGDRQLIWEQADSSETPSGAGSFVFDGKGVQCVFMLSTQKNGKSESSIWYYKAGMERAVEKMNAQKTGILKGYEIGGGKFSLDGSRYFFSLMKRVDLPDEKFGAMVDVWSYADDKLQSQQLKEAEVPVVYYNAVINLINDRVILLQGENEYLFDNRLSTDEYMLLTTKPCFSLENNWRPSCRVPLYLVNTRDGSRQLIKDGLINSDWNEISPNGKYVLYYDFEQQAFFSYTISSGKTVNISQNVPFPVGNKAHARAGLPNPFGLPNHWLPDNKGVIIYDEYDLWQIDPAGIQLPVCLTKGYGRANGIILRLASNEQVITEPQVLLLAFRPSDKANGFYRLNLTNPKSSELLAMHPYLYYWPDLNGLNPLKAVNVNTWLVQRMTASEAPDYFFTSNFKTFQRLSHVQPQKEYNWLTAELHEWSAFDGKKSQGILYKPENFDPRKKYPVIFHFYEKKSDEFHIFSLPELTGHSINIPHFVSNGYLVFVPDIHYTIGETIESVYNSVGSAAHYLSKYSWVDSTKMGLQGHSLGGYEVHALITRTNMFAAAASAAGASDLISNAGSVNSIGGHSLAYLSEVMAYRIGKTIWENRDSYIRNSPVFYADRINTPLLMFNNKADGVVPFGQGVEFFTSLRRLGKRVWMLQYDNGGHQLGGIEAKDYTIRLMQFFDHYLKDRPAPKWMTQGIPAKLKGIETGYEMSNNRDNHASN